MAKYTIGNLIYENRIRRKITQEELSSGICTPVTLSRIENGIQIPHRKTYEALMQRLGLDEQYYLLPVSREEMERNTLEYMITRKLSLKEYDIEEELEQYKNCCPQMDNLEKQYYLYTSALLLKDNNRQPEKMTALLLEAINLTIPEFSLHKLKRIKLLTFNEIIILNNIAINYQVMGKRKEAKELLFCLKSYLEQEDIDPEGKAKVYPMILFNLSNWVGMEGRNELAFELCESGIDFCILYGKLTLFPNLLFNKAYSLVKMNRPQEAYAYFMQACTIFEAVKDKEMADICRKKVYENFAIVI